MCNQLFENNCTLLAKTLVWFSAKAGFTLNPYKLSVYHANLQVKIEQDFWQKLTLFIIRHHTLKTSFHRKQAHKKECFVCII